MDVEGDFNSLDQFSGSKDYSIFAIYKSNTQDNLVLMTSVDPCLPTDWEDPNFDALAFYYSPMMIFATQSHSGGPSNPDDISFVHDNWYITATVVEKQEVGGIGKWHSVAVTYDADGGTCQPGTDPNWCTPGQPTGIFRTYLDGMPTDEPQQYDPSIPEDSIKDIVRLCASHSSIHMADVETVPFVGDIDEIRVYDMPLTHAEVLYLSGIPDPTYFPNTSPANLVLKDPPGPPFDPNNLDIVNFLDYGKLAEHWLEQKLFPFE